MILRAGIFASILAAIVAVLFFFGSPPGSFAQGKIKTSAEWKTIILQTKGAKTAIVSAPTTTFKKLNWLETGKWAKDFLFDPKSAGNREVMHLYAAWNKSNKITAEFKVLLETSREKNIRIALVFLPDFKGPTPQDETKLKLAFAGLKGVVAVPVKADLSNLQLLVSTSKSVRASAAMAKMFYGGYTKKFLGLSGKNVKAINALKVYIAVNHQLESVAPLKTRLIAAKTAWPASKSAVEYKYPE